jgi:hypothetical protein
MRFPKFENAVVRRTNQYGRPVPCVASHRFEVESLRSRPVQVPASGHESRRHSRPVLTRMLLGWCELLRVTWSASQ